MASLSADGGEHLRIVCDGGALLKDEKDHAVAVFLPKLDGVCQCGYRSFVCQRRNRQADAGGISGESLAPTVRRQRSPRKDQIVGHARFGADTLPQRRVIAHQEQVAARDDAAQQPSPRHGPQVPDTDAQRRDANTQHAGEMAEQPLQRQRGESAVVMKHSAAAEDQPAALAEQTRDLPGEADEPVQPRMRLIIENCIDPGRDRRQRRVLAAPRHDRATENVH